MNQRNRNVTSINIMYTNTKHVSVWDPITHLEYVFYVRAWWWLNSESKHVGRIVH